MIAILGHIDVDPEARDRLVAATADRQRATATTEPGCLVYTIAADPADPSRIRIVELWESVEALDAHFQHPNFFAIGEALRAEPRLGNSAVKYRIDAAAPVRGSDGKVTTEFPEGPRRGRSTMAGDQNPSDSYADSYEDVSMYHLDDERERALHDAQTECTFMWTTSTGDPVGVIMNYLVRNGRFWLTCTRRRKRVPAIEARPRVAIAVTSRGTEIGVSQSVTYKGDAVIHDSDEVKAWFYPALAARVRPRSESQQEAFVEHLDTPGRVVIEIVPTDRIGFDAEHMFQNSPAGPTSTRV